MEPRTQHSRGLSDSVVLNALFDKPEAIRKRLLEKCLQQDSGFCKRKQRIGSRSSERLLQHTFGAPLPSSSSSNLNQIPKIPPAIKPASRSSSRQNTSSDTSKLIRPESLGTKSSLNDNKPQKLNIARKKTIKPTDSISKITEKFSVKKINELCVIRCKGEEFICRALVALLSEVDYHIKESEDFSLQVFVEYISSPGIVVQAIKKIPEYVSGNKIPGSSFNKAVELYNQAYEITNNIGMNLLANLLEAVFEVKELNFKRIYYKKMEEVVRHKPNYSLDMSKITNPSSRRTNSNAENVLSKFPYDEVRNIPFAKKKIDIQNSDVTFNYPVLKTNNEFMESKTFLLSKFFTKMGLAKESISYHAKSPAKEFLNRSLELNQGLNDTQSYIKAKHHSRPSSTTPQSENSLKKREKNILNDSKSNKSLAKKLQNQNLKQKKILLGSRFYKKIDDKFIEILTEKLKRESFELKKLRKTNFEEYSKKKDQYISMQKSRWISETVKGLEQSEMLLSINENDVGQEEKRKSMLEHLNQEIIVDGLVRKAEQCEITARRKK